MAEGRIDIGTNVPSQARVIAEGFNAIGASIEQFAARTNSTPLGALTRQFEEDLRRLQAEAETRLAAIKRSFEQAAEVGRTTGSPVAIPGGRNFAAQAGQVGKDLGADIKSLTDTYVKGFGAQVPEIGSVARTQAGAVLSEFNHLFTNARDAVAGLAQDVQIKGGTSRFVGSTTLEKNFEAVDARLRSMEERAARLAAAVGPASGQAAPVRAGVGDRLLQAEQALQASAASARASEPLGLPLLGAGGRGGGSTPPPRTPTGGTGDEGRDLSGIAAQVAAELRAEGEAASRAAVAAEQLARGEERLSLTLQQAADHIERQYLGSRPVGNNIITAPGAITQREGESQADFLARRQREQFFQRQPAEVDRQSGAVLTPAYYSQLTDPDVVAVLRRRVDSSQPTGATQRAYDQQNERLLGSQVQEQIVSGFAERLGNSSIYRLLDGTIVQRTKLGAELINNDVRLGEIQKAFAAQTEKAIAARRTAAEAEATRTNRFLTARGEEELGRRLSSGVEAGTATRLGRSADFRLEDDTYVRRTAAGAREITRIEDLNDARARYAQQLRVAGSKPQGFLQGFSESVTAGRLGGGGARDNFGQAITNFGVTTGTLVRYAAAGAAIGLLSHAIADTKKETLDYIDSLTNLRVRLDDVDGNFNSLTNHLEEFSRLAGSNVGEVLDAAAKSAAAFGRPGEDTAETLAKIGAAGAEAASKLAVISGTTLPVANGDLVAIASSFGLQANQFDVILDAVANAKRLGADANDITSGLASVAGVAAQSGFDPQQAANYISLISARTNFSGRDSATQLTRILGIVNGEGGQNALRRAGVDVDATRGNVPAQFTELAARLNGTDGRAPLDEATKNDIFHDLGGVNNLRALRPLLADNTALVKAYDAALQNTGAGQEEYNRLQNDLSKLLKRIAGDISNIQVNLARSGIFDGVAVSLGLLEPGLRTLSDLLGYFDTLINLVPGLRLVSGTLLDAYLALRLFNSLAAKTGIANLGANVAAAVRRPFQRGATTAAAASTAAAETGATAATSTNTAATTENTAAQQANAIARAELSALVTEGTAATVAATASEELRALAAAELTALNGEQAAAEGVRVRALLSTVEANTAAGIAERERLDAIGAGINIEGTAVGATERRTAALAGLTDLAGVSGTVEAERAAIIASAAIAETELALANENHARAQGIANATSAIGVELNTQEAATLAAALAANTEDAAAIAVRAQAQALLNDLNALGIELEAQGLVAATNKVAAETEVAVATSARAEAQTLINILQEQGIGVDAAEAAALAELAALNADVGASTTARARAQQAINVLLEQGVAVDASYLAVVAEETAVTGENVVGTTARARAQQLINVLMEQGIGIEAAQAAALGELTGLNADVAASDTARARAKAMIIELGAQTLVFNEAEAASLAALTALTAEATGTEEVRATAMAELTALTGESTVVNEAYVGSLLAEIEATTALARANGLAATSAGALGAATALGNRVAQGAAVARGIGGAALAGGRGLLGGAAAALGPFLTGIGGVIVGLVALNSAFHAAKDAVDATSRANEHLAENTEQASRARTTDELGAAATALRANAGELRVEDPKAGFLGLGYINIFSGIVDRKIYDTGLRLFGGTGGDEKARQATAAADTLTARQKALEEARNQAATVGSSAVFGDNPTSVESLTDGLKKLADAGSSARTVIDSLTQALTGLPGQRQGGEGFVKPFGGQQLGSNLAGEIVDDFTGGLSDYIQSKGQSKEDADTYAKEFVDHFLPSTKDPAARAKLQEQVQAKTAQYLKDAGVENGGQLSPQQLDELANQLAEFYVNPKQSEEGQRRTREGAAKRIRESLSKGTTFDALVGDGDQISSNFVQGTLIEQARTLESQRRLETGDPVVGARERLATLQQAAAEATLKHTKVTDLLNLEIRDAQNGLADALRAQQQSYNELAKSQLGDEQVLGRLRIDYVNALRDYTDALARGDQQGANKAQAALNENRRAQDKAIRDAQSAQASSGIAPGDESGKAAVDLANARRVLESTIQYDTNGQQTKAYSDAVTAVRAAERALSQSLVAQANAIAEANVDPRDTVGQANQAYLSAANILQNTAEFGADGLETAEHAAARGAFEQAARASINAQIEEINKVAAAAVPLGDTVGELLAQRDAQYLIAANALNGGDKDTALRRAAELDQQAKLAQVNKDNARRTAGTDSRSAVDTATTNLNNAQATLAAQIYDTEDYWRAYDAVQRGLIDLAKANAQAAATRRRLGIDITDPLAKARDDLQTAQDQLARDANAPQDVQDADRLAVREADANVESTAFSQRLSAVQTAERLGRTSHAAYIQYLQSEHDRLSSIASRTYQQQQQLDQIDGLLKDARNSAAGQFNLGDIKLPSVFQVRRYIKARIDATTGGNLTSETLSRLGEGQPVNRLDNLQTRIEEFSTTRAISQIELLQRALDGLGVGGGPITDESGRSTAVTTVAPGGGNLTINVNGGDINQVKAVMAQYLGPQAFSLNSTGAGPKY